MINLNGKDLSGLARGVEMFRSVRRADARLNAGNASCDACGKQECSWSCERCEKDLCAACANRHPSDQSTRPIYCPGCRPKARANSLHECADCSFSTDDLTAALKHEDIRDHGMKDAVKKNVNGDPGRTSGYSGDAVCVGPDGCGHRCSVHGAKGYRCSGGGSRQCPCTRGSGECADGDLRLFNSSGKDGLRRGSARYGDAVKNAYSDEHPVYRVTYDGPHLKGLQVELHVGPMTGEQIEEYFKQHYVQPTKVLKIEKL